MVSACQGWRGWSPLHTVTSLASSQIAVTSPKRQRPRSSSQTRTGSPIASCICASWYA